MKRTNVPTPGKPTVSKSVIRRVRLTGSGAIKCRNRMKQHCMLNRNPNRHSTHFLTGSEERVVNAMLGRRIRNHISVGKRLTQMLCCGNCQCTVYEPTSACEPSSCTKESCSKSSCNKNSNLGGL